jgi:hypothetical protein
MTSVFFNVVCPVFGMLLANGMFTAPLTAVLNARNKGTLADLNPTPWVAGDRN